MRFVSLKHFSYHLEWVRLNEHGLGEGTIRRLGHTDALPGQGLNDTPMIEVVEVRVGIEVRQGHAVQLCVGQRSHDVWF